MSDALKKSLTDARVLLERVLVGAAASVVVSLGIAIVDQFAAAIMLAGLLGFCLLLALNVANKVGDIAEASAIQLRPRERVEVLRARLRYGGRCDIEPLNSVEMEELRTLEAGLDALGVMHRGANRRTGAKS